MYLFIGIFLMLWAGGALVAVQERRAINPDSLVKTELCLIVALVLMALYLLFSLFGAFFDALT